MHNKLTMNSGFDFDLLRLELDNIGGVDMSEFGFDLTLPDPFDNEMLKEYDGREDDYTAFRRIIVMYKPEEEGKVRAFFGIPEDAQMRVRYTLEEVYPS